MPNFLFWNVSEKPVEQLIARAATAFEIDVLLLAECSLEPTVLLKALNAEGTPYFQVQNLCPRIRIYTKFSPDLLQPLDEGDRYSISKLSLPARQEILLVCAHLPSKREFSPQSQAHECARLARIIVEIERSVGHQRTLLMGDLNVNPFEDGMVSAGALHAVMTKQTASRGERTVQKERYPYFYNPMWSHFGDGGKGPAGTFYYEKSEHLVYFWNMFDQVLLRPELANRFRHEDLAILTSIGATSLMSASGRPDSKVGSDHLPVMLNLEF